MTHGHIILTDGSSLTYIDVSSSGYLSALGEVVYATLDNARFDNIDEVREALTGALRAHGQKPVPELGGWGVGWLFTVGGPEDICDTAIRYLVSLRPDGTPTVLYTYRPLDPDTPTQNGWTVPVSLAQALLEDRQERCAPPVIHEDPYPGRGSFPTAEEQLAAHAKRVAHIDLSVRVDGTPTPATWALAAA